MNLELNPTGAGGLPGSQDVSSMPRSNPDSQTVTRFNELMSAKGPEPGLTAGGSAPDPGQVFREASKFGGSSLAPFNGNSPAESAVFPQTADVRSGHPVQEGAQLSAATVSATERSGQTSDIDIPAGEHNKHGSLGAGAPPQASQIASLSELPNGQSFANSTGSGQMQTIAANPELSGNKPAMPQDLSEFSPDRISQNQAKQLTGEKTAAFAFAQETPGGAPKPLAEQQNRMTDLSSMFSSAMFAGSQPQQASEVPAQPMPDTALSTGDRQQIQDLVSNLLDRILVSDPKTSAGSSVMMQMSSAGQFAGTEIVLTRSNDGTLAVVINAGNQEQYRKLNEAKSKLENSLERLEKGSFTVTVKSHDGDDPQPS